jgi:hypothetical protein
MSGFVYVMSNPSFVGSTLKIGMSERDPTVFRSDELYSTGVPQPFKVEYYAFVDSPMELEQKVHRLLGQYRPNANREFFECDISLAVETIRANAKIKYEELFAELDPLIIKAKNEKKIRAKWKAENEAKFAEENLKIKKEQEVRRSYFDAAQEDVKKFNKAMWSAIQQDTQDENIIRNVRDMVLVAPMLYKMFKTHADDEKLSKTNIFQQIEASLQERLSKFFNELKRCEPSGYIELSSIFVFETKKYIQVRYKDFTKVTKITTYHSMFDGWKIWDEIEYKAIAPKKTNPRDK